MKNLVFCSERSEECLRSPPSQSVPTDSRCLHASNIHRYGKGENVGPWSHKRETRGPYSQNLKTRGRIFSKS